MADSPYGRCTDDSDVDLHRRLLEREATASADLCDRFLNRLTDWITRKYRRVDPHLCAGAAADAIVTLIKSPASYDPSRRKSLFSYLCMSAKGDLLNSIRPKAHQPEILSLDVELSRRSGNDPGRHDDPALPVILKEELAKADETILAPARDGLTPEELAALELMLDGEKRTTAFAQALRIEHLSKPEQKAYVKRAKDKLKIRLQRAKERDVRST
jgi:hypothetical protein